MALHSAAKGKLISVIGDEVSFKKKVYIINFFLIKHRFR